MSTRKYLAQVFAVVILAVLLCGLSVWKDGKGTADEAEEFVWFSSISFWNPPEWSLAEDTVTGQISQRTGVSFTYDIPQKNAGMQLGQMLIKNELPDVISISDVAMQKQLAESGKVWDIQELLEQYDPDSLILKQFPQDVKAILEDAEGGWYCYPSHIGSADMREVYPPCDPYYWDLVYYQSNEGIMFNRAIMERLGLTAEELQTEEQVQEAFRMVKKLGEQTGQELTPLLLNGQKYEISSLPALSKSFGAKWIDGDGSYRDYYFSEQARQALAFINTAYRNGCLKAEQLSYSVEEMQKQLQSGNVFCFIGNLADTGVDERGWEGAAILSSLGDVPAVQVSAQAQVWLHTYISKSCPHPEKIAKWLSFMAGEEGMMLNYFGIEGRDYIMQDGFPVRTKAGMEGQNSMENGLWIFWPFANTTWEKHAALPPEEDSRQAAAHRVQTAMGRYPQSELYEVALTVNLNSDLEEKSGYGELLNSVQEYKNSQLLSVITAESQEQFEAEYGKLIQGLKDMGLVKLDKELNKCYQERCRRYGITLEDNYKETMPKDR